MNIKKIIIPLILLLCIPLTAFSNPIQSALDSIASDHYSIQLNTIVGNFTWEDSGIGTGFSPVLRGMVEKAVKESASYTIVKHLGPVFNDPEAAMLMGPDATSGAGYMIYGTYRLEGNKIIVDLNVFSFIFSSLIGSREITLPLNSVSSGVQIIPENPEVIANIDSSIGTLYGESDLDVFVTTSRGEGGVYHDGEELLLYILASKDCYIKIFHIDVTGRNTVQIFPNSYEINNYLSGGKLLRFPGDRAPFRFTLTAPYGSEYIKVIAGTRQFQSQGSSFQNLGPATRGLILQQVAIEDQEIMAEAQVSYTILE